MSDNERKKGRIHQTASNLFKFGQLSYAAVQRFNHTTAQKINEKPDEKSVIEGEAKIHSKFQIKNYETAQHLFREQMPNLTRQLLGRRYSTIHRVMQVILPDGIEQAAERLLHYVDQTASEWASVPQVLDVAGAASLDELQKDPERSARLMKALATRNKTLAAVEGAIGGVSGLVGSAVDLPLSMAIAIKTVYEIGRGYGFALETVDDRRAVFDILSRMDLGLIAEKQAVLLALRSFNQFLDEGDFGSLSKILHSQHDIEQFKRLIHNAVGDISVDWLNKLYMKQLVQRVTPIAGGAISAFYNMRLIEEAMMQAHEVFEKSRHYINQHQATHLSILDAYQAAVAAKASSSRRNLVVLTNPEVVAGPVVQPTHPVAGQPSSAAMPKSESMTENNVATSTASPTLRVTRAEDEVAAPAVGEEIVIRVSGMPDQPDSI